MRFLFMNIIICMLITLNSFSQSQIFYEASFDNAVHHEANISVTYQDLDQEPFSVRMSRTSPGRYAIHEFAKNVIDFSARDENGNFLEVRRPDPYQWDIYGHKGTVVINYTLFANFCDGTYSQIDETHAHLNIPATFIYAPKLLNRAIEIKLQPRKDLNWKVATQLKPSGPDQFHAPNLHYFMDSPIEMSNHVVKSYKINSKGKDYQIRFALHQLEGNQGFDSYFDFTKNIVQEQKSVFEELPDFDFNSYTFIACYLPQADKDGMEHRNSTVLTSMYPLDQGGFNYNIGTVSHEFFHAWNVERLRPLSLEPFDYEDANISGELWFAEGFTSYYGKLILCRAGVMTPDEYVKSLARDLNSLINSPARKFSGPIGMSQQATFVDAATSIDPVNRENTFISYYRYGSVLGLALDLSLRNMDEDKNLDDFMKMLWNQYGRKEIPYELSHLQNSLTAYTNQEFSQKFFGQYVYKSDLPDFKNLLASVGIKLEKEKPGQVDPGAEIIVKDGKWLIATNPKIGSSLYNAGMVKGDRIVSINGKLTHQNTKPKQMMNSFSPGDEIKMVYNRFGDRKEAVLSLQENPSLATTIDPKAEKSLKRKRNEWLEAKRSSQKN